MQASDVLDTFSTDTLLLWTDARTVDVLLFLSKLILPLLAPPELPLISFVLSGGGCSDPSPNTPSYQLIANQDRDNLRVRALINCHTSQTPVALIAGKNYHYFPWLKEKDVRYAVLGYYLVTHVWVSLHLDFP